MDRADIIIIIIDLVLLVVSDIFWYITGREDGKKDGFDLGYSVRIAQEIKVNRQFAVEVSKESIAWNRLHQGGRHKTKQ